MQFPGSQVSGVSIWRLENFTCCTKGSVVVHLLSPVYRISIKPLGPKGRPDSDNKWVTLHHRCVINSETRPHIFTVCKQNNDVPSLFLIVLTALERYNFPGHVRQDETLPVSPPVSTTRKARLYFRPFDQISIFENMTPHRMCIFFTYRIYKPATQVSGMSRKYKRKYYPFGFEWYRQ